MTNQAAQTMLERALAAWTGKHRTAADDRAFLAGYETCQSDMNAALSQPAGVAEVKRDREGDRLRFPDADFNAWLDAGISDAGHTVYDSISSIEDAWQGWHGHVLSVMLDENPDLDAMLSAAPAASGGEDYSACCDTPAYCSSVRRCTAKDSPPSGASVSERARDE